MVGIFLVICNKVQHSVEKTQKLNIADAEIILTDITNELVVLNKNSAPEVYRQKTIFFIPNWMSYGVYFNVLSWTFLFVSVSIVNKTLAKI